MADVTVAKIIVDSLEAAGVKRIYGIVGDSLNGITNSLAAQKKIEWVHVRHEETAAFAAGAEAHLTEKIAVCAGSCGPGNTHLINGLYDCHRSRVPVLAIAAHIPRPEIGSEYFQETHPEVLFRDCSVYCETVTVAQQLPRVISIAMQTAISQSGVAVIIISGDFALEEVPEKKPTALVHYSRPSVVPSKKELDKIAQILNESKKITLLCGSGCKNAHEELMEVCSRLNAPMVHALRAKEYVEHNNPYDVGMTGFIGFASGYYAMESCDTLLLLGTSFPYRQFYPSDKRVIQIDIRGEQLGKRVPVEVGVVGDVKSTLQALLPLLEAKEDKKFLDKALSHYQKSRQDLDDLATATRGKKLIHPQFIAKTLGELADEDAIFTCDVGTPTVWAARYLKMNGKRRLIGSFNHGSMANALPQAIGAQSEFPDRQVIAMCGDGGFSMLMGDVLTLIQHKLPIKIVIFNNSTLGFVELEMKAGGMLDYGTNLVNPNFAELAKAIGVYGVRIEDPSDAEDELKKALEHEGPAIVDVAINRLELIIPPKLVGEQIKGFSLYMARAIINGRGNEVLELLKTNLWE